MRDEVARVAVCLGPLADDGWRYIIEFARQALRLEEAAEAIPKASVVVAQCRRELVGCAIPLPASLVGGRVDEVASRELAVLSEAAERRVQKRVQIDPSQLACVVSLHLRGHGRELPVLRWVKVDACGAFEIKHNLPTFIPTGFQHI